MSKRISKKRKSELSEQVNYTVEQFKKEYPNIKSPITNSYEAIEEIGFFIIGKHVKNDISGFHLNIGDYKCIFVNRSHHYARQNQSLWHEVYHWYTNDIGHISNSENSDYEEMEFKAENFASKVLIDREILKKKVEAEGYNIKYITRVNIVKLQNYFNASYMNVARALLEVYPDDFNPNRMNIGQYKNQDKLIEFCKENNLDSSIYDIPSTDYITNSFVEDLKINYEDGLLSDEYLESVLDLIDEELKLNEG